jgi:tyrosyl-tRNA synthetase
VPEDLPPRDAKRALARELVAQFHDAGAAEAAEQEFDRVHRERGVPDEIDEVQWPAAELGESVHLPELIRRAFGVSTSEARRALAQGGVSLDGEPVPEGVLDLPAAELDSKVLKLGKRRFARVRVV